MTRSTRKMPPTVLITGCSTGGIGASLAAEFHERGLHVIATARTISKMAELGRFPNMTLMELDVTSISSIKAAARAVAAQTGGKLEYLVNNSSQGMTMPALDTNIEDAKKLFDVNFWGLIAVTQAFAPLVIAAKGSILNVASTVAFFHLPWVAMYGSSKAAVMAFGETLRLELAPFGVNVLNLVAGSVESNTFATHTEPHLPANSLYTSAVREMADCGNWGNFRRKQPGYEFSKEVVQDVLAGRSGIVRRGSMAGVTRWVSEYAPLWVTLHLPLHPFFTSTTTTEYTTKHDGPPHLSPAGSDISFGAVVGNVDLENLTDVTWATIHDALYKHLVVVVKNQHHLSPKAQYLLTQRFDPSASTYGHGKTLDAKRSVLHPDLKTVPHQPQVQIIGHGHIDSYEGLTDFQLRHPHHRTFHRDPVSPEGDHDFTRFYRWHIDAALYDFYPPRVTTLLAVQVPKGRRQTLRYDDGSDETLDVPLGTTAFVSGEKMFSLLSDEDKEFALTSRIEYAPHPYIWMSRARALPTGLGLYSENLELPAPDLPPIDPSKIQILPMVWKNPLTGNPALQIHPSAVHKIHLKDGSVIDDLTRVREIVYKLQRPAISPKYVYAHDWEEGDLVLFHNRGVLHSVVGAFGDEEVRLFRQCNLAAGEGPVAY